MENVTTPDQLELLEMSKYTTFGRRDRGTGRPTKKERRDIEQFMDPLDDYEDLFIFTDDDDE